MILLYKAMKDYLNTTMKKSYISTCQRLIAFGISQLSTLTFLSEKKIMPSYFSWLNS